MTGAGFDPEYVEGVWQRARETMEDARLVRYPHSVANRAYYAAFYAVTALFAAQGAFFRKHTQLEAAVHRDLVNADIWPANLGKAFSDLLRYRTTGDYRFIQDTDPQAAAQAIELAEQIIQAVHDLKPDLFPL